jgi:hypothetical protein
MPLVSDYSATRLALPSDIATMPERATDNVLGKRDDHASEMIRNLQGLLSITYCNNKKEDIEITILAL